MRVLGSLGFVAAARAAHLVVHDTAEERSLFIPMKNNLATKQPGRGFRVVPKAIAGGIQTSCIEWDTDDVTATADEALAAAAGREGDKDSDKSSIGEAMNFLRDLLIDGPVSVTGQQCTSQERVARSIEAWLRRPVRIRHDGTCRDEANHASRQHLRRDRASPLPR